VTTLAVVGDAALIARCRASVSTARQLSLRHSSLTSHWQTNLQAFLDGLARFETNLQTCRLHDGSAPAPLTCVFWLRCRVNEAQAFAVWREARLLADPRLVDRARMLIDLNETFALADRDYVVAAGLDEPLQAALTLVRAADHVLDFRFSVDDLDVSFQGSPPLGG
jgi:hypothetical protein